MSSNQICYLSKARLFLLVYFVLSFTAFKGVAQPNTDTSQIISDTTAKAKQPSQSVSKDNNSEEKEFKRPDEFFLQTFYRWLYETFGPIVVSIIGFFILLILGILAIGEKGRSWLKKKWRYLRHPIPEHIPNKFTVVICELANDSENKMRKQILAGFEDLKEFDGLEFIDLGSLIDPQDTTSSGRKVAARARANELLHKHRADILIWGEVLVEKTVRLSWLSRTEDTLQKRYTFSTEGECPPLLLDDLKALLCSIILPPYAGLDEELKAILHPIVFPSGAILNDDWKALLNSLIPSSTPDLSDDGQYVADKLKPVVSQLDSLFTSNHSLTKEQHLEIRFLIANACYTIGDQSGDNSSLIRSIELYRSVIKEVSETDRLKWAFVQNRLGITLMRLGERQPASTHLEEAIDAFRETLKEWTQDRTPIEWAKTQNNIGATLLSLGERESGTTRLEQAVIACRNALKEWTRNRVPLSWAKAQNNLGIALTRLGERKPGTEQLEAAVVAYREALKEYSQDRVPLLWAMTQANLGVALKMIAEREIDTKPLEEAVTAYREVLKVYRRDRLPLEWAATQHNLGGALHWMAERESGTERLKEAVTAYRETLKERTRDRAPLDWALTQNNLGNVYFSLWKKTKTPDWLYRSFTCYLLAWKEFQIGAPYYLAISRLRILDCLNEIIGAGLFDNLQTALGEDYLILEEFIKKEKSDRPSDSH